MAIAEVTKTARRAPARATEGTLRSLRLPEEDATALRWFFNDYGSQAGLKSNFGDMIQRIAVMACALERPNRKEAAEELRRKEDAGRRTARGIRKAREGGYDADVEVSIAIAQQRPASNSAAVHDPFERLVAPNMLEEIGAARRTHRRLSAMIAAGQSKMVTVLHRFYGPRPPGELRRDIFGDMAPLVEYTATVDGMRDNLVDKTWRTRCVARMTRDSLAVFRESLTEIELSDLAQAKQQVTTADAVRDMCDVNVVRWEWETKSAHEGRAKEAKARVHAMATPIIREATELLIAASNAFRATGLS